MPAARQAPAERCASPSSAHRSFPPGAPLRVGRERRTYTSGNDSGNASIIGPTLQSVARESSKRHRVEHSRKNRILYDDNAQHARLAPPPGIRRAPRCYRTRESNFFERLFLYPGCVRCRKNSRGNRVIELTFFAVRRTAGIVSPVHFPGIPRAQGRPSRACPGIPRDNIRNGTVRGASRAVKKRPWNLARGSPTNEGWNGARWGHPQAFYQ